MTYRIYTTYNEYKDGLSFQEVKPFPKKFATKEEAQKFGEKFFEPPQAVLGWKVKEGK